jgi:uncharacterized protein (TIGR03085 family)
VPSQTVARTERAALCDTLLRVGPDAPTLCPPWRTRDLAAHLVVREHRPDLAVEARVPRLGERLVREQRDLAESTPWVDLVEKLRNGPPGWHPARFAPIDDALNALEFFVHHEDVLRAGPAMTSRALSPTVEGGVWTALKRSAKLVFRTVDAGLVLAAPGFGRIAVRAPSRRGSVTVTAAPGELALLGFGRREHAHYDARGSRQAVTALESARLGA